MTKLVINVDDFGITEGVNNAVFRLNEIGVVKSTTCLVNSPFFESGVLGAKNYPTLKLGIHLTLDLYDSLSGSNLLCDENNMFFKADTHELTRDINPAIIYEEWKLQIDKFIQVVGHLPSHIDSHHHAHIQNKSASMAVSRLAKEYNIPVRGMKSSGCDADTFLQFYNELVSLDTIKSCIEKLQGSSCDLIDLMCHPSDEDEVISNISSYNTMRQAEFNLLSSLELQQLLTENNIEIESY